MDLSGARWFKSSFSGEGNNGADCVEVAFLAGGRVALRDTKDRSVAAHVYPAAEWDALLAAIRAGDLDA